MKEYIERQAVEEFIQDGLNNPDKSKAFGHDAIEILAGIHFMLAADVVEVRHGRWVDENKNPVPWDECNSKCPSHSAYCSECGEWLTASDEYPVTGLYCPHCGALMDGKETDHD